MILSDAISVVNTLILNNFNKGTKKRGFNPNLTGYPYLVDDLLINFVGSVDTSINLKIAKLLYEKAIHIYLCVFIYRSHFCD